MKHGKREMPRQRRNKKGLTALVALVLIFCCTVGGTLAWLFTKSESVKNTFVPSAVTTEVHEDHFTGGTKSNVKVKNTGDVKAYIRAVVVVNWADAKGNVYGGAVPAEGEDYKITMNKDAWKKIGGYWYCKSTVASQAISPVLISSCTPENGKAPAGYDLQVTILAEGIQADGGNGTASAMELAWGVDPSTLS